MYALYVTHPQVVIDPDVPMPRWGLSPEGEERARKFAHHPLVKGVRNIVSSTERKAVELAQAMAVSARCPFTTGHEFGENDRSSTGFLPGERFERVVDAFFANPDQSIEGWEPAREAQARIAGAFEATIALQELSRPIAFTGHGAVGTLLKCYLAGREIARREDQRVIGDPGGGNVFVIRLADRKLFGDWTPMEDLPEQLPF
jgi:broad specificity phosphatase PhoE